MDTYNKLNEVDIVYFSGTGGTKRIAEQFAITFAKHGVKVKCHEICYKNIYKYQKSDMLIMLYPVYALNAPKPIYNFIKNLPSVKQTPSTVISVSGGGEITPNKASRLHCIRRLEK